MESLAAPAIIASLWMRNAPSFLFKRHISQDVTEDELKKNKKITLCLVGCKWCKVLYPAGEEAPGYEWDTNETVGESTKGRHRNAAAELNVIN